jgi:hypothetical protein
MANGIEVSAREQQHTEPGSPSEKLNEDFSQAVKKAEYSEI